MKRVIPIILTIAIMALSVGMILHFGAALPERVASHFGIEGKADGWMSRDQTIRFFICFTLGFPLFLPALMVLVRLFSSDCFNVPNAKYWRKPENFRHAKNFLFFFSWWMAAMSAVFAAGIFLLILQANRTSPPVMHPGGILTLTGGFIAGTIIWIICMVIYFQRTPGNGRPGA